MMRLLLVCVVLGTAGCVLDLTAAPCTDESHCPKGQYCGPAGRCVVGSPPGATGPKGSALVTIRLSPENPTVPQGSTLQLLALGTSGDGSSQELTSLVAWSAASDRVTISNATGSRGLVRALAQGATEITARFGGVEGRTVLFVTSPALVSLELTPTQPAIAVNTTQQFVATGTLTDGTTQDLSSQVTWSSSQPAVATVSNASGARGLATALSQGTSTLGAALGEVSGKTLLIATSATLTSLAVTPTNPTGARGTTRRFTATGRFSDGTTQDVSSLVSWGSSVPGVATISNVGETRGLASLVTAGSTSISASLNGATATSSLSVSGATLTSLSLSPTQPSIARGSMLPLTATALYSDSTTQDVTANASWRSASPTVSSVSDEVASKGQLTGLSPGTAEISATLNGLTGVTTVNVTAATLTALSVTPISPTLGVGTTRPFQATGTYSDNTTQDLTAAVGWLSSEPSRLTISNALTSKGLATAVSSGAATISASLTGVVGTTPVTVSAATLTSIAVSPSSASIPLGSTRLYTAVGTASDGSTQDLTAQCTWASSDPTVATLSNANGSRGLATSLEAGSTTVTATLNGRQGSATLSVTAATLTSLTISPTNPTVPRGSTRQFSALGTYSDASTQDLTEQVTWTSSSTQVATISNAAGSRGLASAVTTGTATLTATLGATTHSTTMLVSAATLVSIAVSPSGATLYRFTGQQFVATGTYSDGSTQPLTQQVTWTSSNSPVVDISNAVGSKGQGAALSVGTSSIAATLNGVVGQAPVTVADGYPFDGGR